MSQSYQVNYSINVNSQAALNSIQKFQEATLALAECEKRIKKVTTALSNMTTKSPVLKVSTESINKKLDVVIRKLERIHSLSATSTGMLGGGGAKTSTKTKTAPAPIPAVPVGTSTGGTGNKKTKVKTPQPVKPKGAAGSNIGYKIFGPSMLDTGGIGAFEMAKGMGIAYGIAGLGSWVGSIVKDYAQYDNMMKTSYNILKTHDKGSNFQGRFDDMARTIRNVGVQTKFTAPEVADAGKFLAMAGFNIDDINKSIVPIANLALIGDTDLGATADITTNIMTGYGIAAGQIGKASDIMAMTFTSSNTTLTEIAEAYKYSASLLSAGGIGFEEATAALGILGDAGVKGSQAGTTMRTIMANIVKPTNKQQAHWDRVGVARYDKDGNVRDLLDIFQDLSAKDLGVADFYQLFHKTAAQGAVSLTKNVDKWNTVIERNFLSDGLAHKLAEEKKNTLQGMWAQLTSSFVETGMQAFAGVEGQIKDLLSKAIEWARSPEALEATKKLFTNVIELMRMMASMAHSFANLSPLFMHTIMAWAKLQVIAAPIMIVVRSLRALSNIGSGLVSVLSFFKGVVGLTSTGLVGALAPIGAALAGIAVLGGVALYNMYQENQAKLEAASGFLENWAGTVFVANGYLTKGMDPAARYLQLVYDKQLSANDKVAEYIRLRKEEMGLTSKYNIDNDGKTVADVLGDKYTQMAGVSGSSIKEMVGVLEPTWRILPAWVSKQFFVSDLSTKGGFSSGQWLSPTEKIDIYKGVKAISDRKSVV